MLYYDLKNKEHRELDDSFFNEYGYALCKDITGKYFIDKTGERISNRYESCDLFKNGYSVCYNNGYFYFLNSTAQEEPIKYMYIGNSIEYGGVINDFLIVSDAGSWGRYSKYIQVSKQNLSPSFKQAYPFNKFGTAIVKFDNEAFEFIDSDFKSLSTFSKMKLDFENNKHPRIAIVEIISDYYLFTNGFMIKKEKIQSNAELFIIGRLLC